MSVAVSGFSRDLILEGKMEKFYISWLLFAGALACGLICDCALAKQYACSHSPHLVLACDALAHTLTVLLFSLLSSRGRKERGGGEGERARASKREKERERGGGEGERERASEREKEREREREREREGRSESGKKKNALCDGRNGRNLHCQ